MLRSHFFFFIDLGVGQRRIVAVWRAFCLNDMLGFLYHGVCMYVCLYVQGLEL